MVTTQPPIIANIAVLTATH